MTPAELTVAVKTQAAAAGFALAGVCAAVEPTGIHRFAEWLGRGYDGEMKYLQNRFEAYRHPGAVLDGVRSLVMLAFPYRTEEPAACPPGAGRISRYAWGPSDYHDLIHDRLHTLADFIREQMPGAAVRGVVDSAPLLEREFAQLAGLGWVGKNTLLLNRAAGSYFFLAALLTDQELIADEPFTTDHCGSCTACLDACPTAAFPQPYVLDATRCISYLTIELRGPIPADLRPGVEDWLFGCDVCQDVCPWNRKSPIAETPELQPQADANPVDLLALFDLDDAGFRRRFRDTPLWRAKRRGILRNAAIVLGNQKCLAAVPALIRGLKDGEPLIRGACAWALQQMTDDRAHAALTARREVETDPQVRAELGP